MAQALPGARFPAPVTRWLVTGARGQLGTHLTALLDPSTVVAVGRAELDVTSGAAVDAIVRDVRPDVVVNAAAYTAVDDAESDEAAAALVNADAPGLLASAVARTGGRLIHVSTDYVFAGDAHAPYEPTDETGPRTAYGRTKLAGEQAALAALPSTVVVRSAWLYGGPGRNFVDTMVSLERSRDTVDVVADQLGSPTWVRDLAGALVALGSAPGAEGGVLHYVNTGKASWFELAQEVFRLIGAEAGRIQPATSAAFVRAARRPAWSVLSTRSWTDRGLPAPRGWRTALRECLSDPAGRT
ncbi:MAG: dTDP-4-dehydrorhamnose reductase [Pseudonocardiales bacterium]|nr:dTDP-4-dehydrorhamnose reductase [Pseudonocardiales bacterium]